MPFLLFLAWLNYIDRRGVMPLVLLACLLHELGHYCAIEGLGGTVQKVRLTLVGAEMKLQMPLDYWREGVSALAGPGLNLLVAWLFCWWEWGAVFSGINLVLGCFNLMPVGRLDGGRALRCTLALVVGAHWAELIGLWVDVAFTILLASLGLMLFRWGGSITLLLIAMWLLMSYVKE